jgi:hypothetical protein
MTIRHSISASGLPAIVGRVAALGLGRCTKGRQQNLYSSQLACLLRQAASYSSAHAAAAACDWVKPLESVELNLLIDPVAHENIAAVVQAYDMARNSLASFSSFAARAAACDCIKLLESVD